MKTMLRVFGTVCWAAVMCLVLPPVTGCSTQSRDEASGGLTADDRAVIGRAQEHVRWSEWIKARQAQAADGEGWTRLEGWYRFHIDADWNATFAGVIERNPRFADIEMKMLAQNVEEAEAKRVALLRTIDAAAPGVVGVGAFEPYAAVE